MSTVPERSPEAEQPPSDERPPEVPEGILLTLVATAESVALMCNSPKTRTAAALSGLLARYLLELRHKRWLRLRSRRPRRGPARAPRPAHPEAAQPSVSTFADEGARRRRAR